MNVAPLDDPRIAFDVEQACGSPRSLAELTRHLRLTRGFVARGDDGVAMAVGTLASHDDADGVPAIAWLGGIMTRLGPQREDATCALVHAMLADAQARGARVIGLDALASERAFYESEGFRPLIGASRWSRAMLRAEAVVSARHSVHPISISEAMEIAAFDLPRFGARRMPFLMDLLHAFPWNAFMARDRASGDVTGFVFGGERMMGPLVAEDDEAAAALLSACEVAGGTRALLARDDHAGARRVLEAAGYARDGLAFTRMTWGGVGMPGRQDAHYGIGT